MSKSFQQEWPNEHFDEFVDFIGLVPGDVATIRIEAKSFVRVFVYKSKSEAPVVTFEKN